MTVITSPSMRYHGGKFRLGKWIIAQFPAHYCYVECYGGAAGVLIQKPRAPAEIYNDLDDDVVNFFRVLQCPVALQELIRRLSVTPYARREFMLAFLPSTDPVERARRICIRAQMGFGSAGASKGTTGFRIDSKRAYGTASDLWAQYPDTITTLAQRFHRVIIENRPALRVLVEHDTPRTLHYCDPPYLPALRVARGMTYKHEMSVADHQALLATLVQLQGMVCLSGYASELYSDTLTGWKMITKSARASARRGTKLATEVLWINPACARRAGQATLF